MKSFKIYFLTKILPYFLQYIVRFIFITSKKRYHYSSVDENEALLITMWHGDLLMQPLNYRKFRKNGSIKVIVSEHKDGLIIKKVCEYLGVGGIPGSSSRGAIKALKNAIKELRSGNDVAITPDGPRGPRYSVADGVIAIAQKTKTRIVCLNSVPQSYWQINSWDKFIVPKPFGTIDFYVSKPLDITGMEFEEARDFIKEEMMKKAMP